MSLSLNDHPSNTVENNAFFLGETDGEAKVVKLIVESADSANNSITYRVIEGNVKNEFSSFTAKIEATQKGEGSQARLTLGHIKLNEGIAHPETLLELGIQVFKMLGSYLTQA